MEFNPDFFTGGRRTRKIELRRVRQEDGSYVPYSTSSDSHELAYLEDANTICSDLENGNHRPVIDVDLGVRALPTSTAGHFHLYIEKELSWPQYAKLLRVMAEVGIVEQGYVDASLAHGYTVARLPWVDKYDEA